MRLHSCLQTERSNRCDKMNWFVAALALSALVHGAHSASNTVAWCYHLPTCNDTTWPTIATQFCNGSRQSPINIVTAAATTDGNLTAFNFTNYDNKNQLDYIMNTGMTVKVTFKSGARVSGGDLGVPYDSLQFHLHWGNGTSRPGSEHTVNGKRYPMELHIVNAKSSFNGNTTLAVADSTGLAALGFFIEEGTADDVPAEAWRLLSSYLSRIPHKGDDVAVTDAISLDDLLHGVDRTQYYRYLGSLTTPNCNEAVVWTVFKGTIKVSKEIIDLFGNSVRIGNSSSIYMVDVYRNLQPDQPVRVTASSSSTTCYSLGLMALSFILGRS